MKSCPKCCLFLDLTMFHKSSASSDGHSSYCKPCMKNYLASWKEKNLTQEKATIYKNRFKERHPGYATQRKKEWAKANPEKFAEQRRRKEKKAYEKLMKEKYGPNYIVGDPSNRSKRQRPSISKEEARKRHNARRVTQKAILRGELIKQPCFICGVGGDDVEVHHPSYSAPLAISWLCKQHHLELHKEHKHRLLSQDRQ